MPVSRHRSEGALENWCVSRTSFSSADGRASNAFYIIRRLFIPDLDRVRRHRPGIDLDCNPDTDEEASRW